MKMHQIFLWGALLSYFTTAAAQTPDAFCFDRNVFEYIFTRADAEIDPLRWVEKARDGISRAVSAWERIAADYFSDSAEARSAKSDVDAWSEREFEERYQQWLSDRFFGPDAARARARALKELNDSKVGFLYRRDSEGRILFDEITGDPLIRKSSEIVEDQEQWRARAQALRDELGFSGGRAARELDAVFAQEERLFLIQRGADTWSLRKQSEDAAASAVLSRLVRETEVECSSALAALQTRIDSAVAGTGDLALAGIEWLDSFREQFSRGLDAWERAEARFMADRLAWERDAANNFLAGAAAWETAFTELAAERRSWEAAANRLFAAGEEAFKNASVELERAIANSRAEFDRDAALRLDSSGERARSWADTYMACVGVAAASKENASFWLRRLGHQEGNDPALDDAGIDAWLSSVLPSLWNTTRELYEKSESYQRDEADIRTKEAAWEIAAAAAAEKEIERAARADDVRARMQDLAQVQAEESGDTYSAETALRTAQEAYSDAEASSAVAHAAAAEAREAFEEAEASLPEKHPLWLKLRWASEQDEYRDDELVAQAREYLGGAIADAPGFPDYQEALRWIDLYRSYGERAKSARASLIGTYGAAFGTEAESLQAILDTGVDTADFNLDEYQLALIRANAVGKYWSRRTAIAEEVARYAAQTGVERSTEAESEAAWRSAKDAYDRSLNEYARAQEELSAAGADVGAAKERAAEAAEALAAADAALETLHQEYALLMSAYAVGEVDFLKKDLADKYAELVEQNELIDGEDGDPLWLDFVAKAQSLGRAQNSAAAAETLYDLVASSDASFSPAVRADAIALIGTVDSDTWYTSRAGKAVSIGRSLEEVLQDDHRSATRNLLRARVRLELDALRCKADPTLIVTDDVRSLADASAINGDEALVFAGELAMLDAVLNDQHAATDEAYRSAIDALVLNHPRTADFVLGTGYFDGTSDLLIEENEALDRSVRLLTAYSAVADSAPVFEASRTAAVVDGIRDALLPFCPDAADGELPAADQVVRGLCAEENGPVFAMADFAVAMRGAVAEAPDWIRREIEGWLREILLFAARRARLDDPLFDGDTTAAQAPNDDTYRSETVDSILEMFAQEREAEQADSSNGRAHWRMYLPTEDSSPGVLPASSWREGRTADSAERSRRARDAANGALSFWTDPAFASSQEVEAVRSAALHYLNHPDAVWSHDDLRVVDSLIKTDYEEARSYARGQESVASLIQAEIGRLGAVIAAADSNDARLIRIEGLSQEIDRSRRSYAEALAAYEERAADFSQAGAEYDRRYAVSKETYETVEAKRFDFDIQDAVKRWASTAYLADSGDSASSYRDPRTELAYARSHAARADAAINALRDLYGSAETSRPYRNDEYRSLYDEYKASLSRLSLAIDVRDVLAADIGEETARNADLHAAYRGAFIATTLDFPADALPSADLGERTWKDVLTVDAEGHLRFSISGDFRLVGYDEAGRQALAAYFGGSEIIGADGHASTAFERELREWTGRIAESQWTDDRFRSWAFARDYLVERIVTANEEYAALTASRGGADALRQVLGAKKVGSDRIRELIDELRAGDIYRTSYIEHPSGAPEDDGPWTEAVTTKIRPGLQALQSEAWESLDAQERLDLEFMVILTLTGQMDNFDLLNALESASEMEEIAYVYGRVCERRHACWRHPLRRDEYYDMKELQDEIDEKYLDPTSARAAKGGSALVALVETADAAYRSYRASSDSLARMRSDTVGGSVAWVDIEAALRESGRFDEERIRDYEPLWLESMDAGLESEASVAAAVDRLCRWVAAERENLRSSLDLQYAQDRQVQVADEAAFRRTLDSYIEGTATIAELRGTAERAFGPQTASAKTHLSNLEDACGDYLSGRISGECEEYVSLVQRAEVERLSAELESRAIEWDIIRNDLAAKVAAWRDAASLVWSRGQADWSRSTELMQEKRAVWAAAYKREYEKGRTSWDAAVLESLDEKNDWVAQATDAAAKASTGALLALVGSDGTAAARRLDTRRIAGLPVGGTEALQESRRILDAALDGAGIVSLDRSMGSLYNGSAASIAAIRSGIGGSAAWNSATLNVAASRIAREANTALAARHSAIVAVQAREAARSAVQGLRGSVDEANRAFAENMDRAFILEGAWHREGNNYVKRVVVGSTLIDPYLHERASVAGFIAYVLNPWKPTTDLSDGNLQKLDSYGIQALIEAVQREVAAKAAEIFGDPRTDDDSLESRTKIIEFYKNREVLVGTRSESYTDEEGASRIIEVPVYQTVRERLDDKTQTRVVGAGLFGAHLGYEPVLKLEPNPEDGMDEVFKDAGSGELGRLLRSYIYWSLKEGAGWSEACLPSWDKRIWNDAGSWFKAPTLRSVTDLGVAVAATAVSGGLGAGSLAALAASSAINLADDAVFTLMDIDGGYKTWEEAGGEFGKKALASAAAAVVNGGFGALHNAFSEIAGIDGVIARAAVGGAQSFTAGTVSGAVDALYWNGNGFGWDGRIFTDRAMNGGISALTGMGGTFANGFLDLGLEGYQGAVYRNAAVLSSVAGGLAEQGLNYALQGDFVLNMLNASNLSGGMLQGGLLELHLGGHGASMNMGMGGADVNFSRIATAALGFEAWSVNAAFRFGRQDEGRSFASSLRTLYSGNEVEQARYRSLMDGSTNIVLDDSADFRARTVFDEASNTTTIALGRSAFEDGSRFGLNILLSHEAYRNGLDDGAATQQAETERAVLGHMMTAASLASLYGSSSIGRSMNAELESFFAAASGFGTERLARTLASYDSSGDYWLIKRDGSIEDTVDRAFYREIIDGEGNVRQEKIVGSEYTGSRGLALYRFLGEGMVDDMLGSSSEDLSRFDTSVVQEALGWDAQTIRAAKKDGLSLNDLSPEAQHRIKIEQLFSNYGYSYTDSSGLWEGSSMKVPGLRENESIGIRLVGGEWQKFTAGMTITRDPDAFSVYRDGVASESYDVKDSADVSFYKRDLDSGVTDYYHPDFAWASIDKIPDGSVKIRGHNYEGNTIVSEWFKMHLTSFSGNDYGVSTVGVFTDATILSGETLNKGGWRTGYAREARWLMHPFGIFGRSNGCIGPMTDNGIKGWNEPNEIGQGAYHFQQLLNEFTNWGVYQGYEFSVRMLGQRRP